ncbi:MAG: glycerophosphoryl diester phosphodiesterase membrane domain-containing protein [Propioniciclava sp.]
MIPPTLKPGVLGLGEHFSGAWATYRSRFLLFVGLSLAPQLLFAAVTAGMLAGLFNAILRGEERGTEIGVFLIVAVNIVVVVGYLIAALVQYRFMAMTVLAADDLASGQSPGWSELLARTRGFTGRILGLFLVVSLGSLAVLAVVVMAVTLPFTGLDAAPDLGMLMILVVPGLLLYLVLLAGSLIIAVRVLYLIPAIAVEHLNGFEGLRRSWSLTRGVFWPTLGYYLLLGVVTGLPVTIISNVVSVLAIPLDDSLPTAAPVTTAIIVYLLIIAVAVVVVPFNTIFVTVMYTSRVRALAGEPPSTAVASPTGFPAQPGYPSAQPGYPPPPQPGYPQPGSTPVAHQPAPAPADPSAPSDPWDTPRPPAPGESQPRAAWDTPGPSSDPPGDDRPPPT